MSGVRAVAWAPRGPKHAPEHDRQKVAPALAHAAGLPAAEAVGVVRSAREAVGNAMGIPEATHGTLIQSSGRNL